jgi:hypothetical protein
MRRTYTLALRGAIHNAARWLGAVGQIDGVKSLG